MVKFFRATQGMVAVQFGLLLMSLMLVIGVSIDFSRLKSLRGAAQLAADAAALYGIHQNNTAQDDLNEALTRLVNEHLSQDFDVSNLQASGEWNADGNLVVNVTGDMDPIFLGLGGVETMDFEVSAEATTGANGIEIALAFDTTNSMDFGNTWQVATATLDDILNDIASYSGAGDLYVTLIPFQDRVAVGSGNSGWATGFPPTGWEGCLEPREEVDGAFNWALDDDDPTNEPFAFSKEGVTGGLAARGGRYPHCPNTMITGPTTNIDEIIAAAQGLNRNGTGRFDVGLAWAWRAVSDQWAGRWGVPDYPSSEHRKIVFYLSDGRSEAYTFETFAQPGPAYNRPRLEAFEQLEHICDQMKADGIELWMVQVNGNPDAQPYFERCASENKFHHVIENNTDLELVFQVFRDEISSQVRLVN